MSDKISRRVFIKQSAGWGAATVVGRNRIPAGLETGAKAGKTPEIAVVEGKDPLGCAQKAVELIGGMRRYVPAGSRVALLPNTQSRHPGTFTNPELVRAAIRMCREAGAKEVNALSWLPVKFWKATGLDEVLEEEGAGLKISGMEDEFYRKVPLPKGIALKAAYILRKLDEHDILIDMPIIKDHAGNKFTGTMKNLMGLNAPSCNRIFHKDNWETDRSALEHLDQCIADLNLAVTPDLCIVDATTIITTNGPFGPGKLAKPGRVAAGTDRIAIDAYCTSFLDLSPTDIIMIRKGAAHGLGEIDLSRVKVIQSTA